MPRQTCRSWSTGPLPVKRSSSLKRASRKPSSFRTNRREKSGEAAKICWESPLSPRISTLLCRLKHRNISSRRREGPNRHAFLWWDRQLRSLSRSLRAAIEDGANDVFVSAASIWEIAIKRESGELRFDRPIVATALALGFEILAVTRSHAERAGALPRHHGDPFDRLIIAQAYLEGIVLGTQDRIMQPYGVATLGLD